MSSETQQVIRETKTPTYFTNDIKLASALVTSGLPIVKVDSRQNTKHKKPEILFGFEQNDKQKAYAMAFLSGNLKVDARAILDNRDCLLTYISNGSRDILENMGI